MLKKIKKNQSKHLMNLNFFTVEEGLISKLNIEEWREIKKEV